MDLQADLDGKQSKVTRHCLNSYNRFSNANAMSDCNKKTIHDSFEAQVPTVWSESWGSLSC